MKIVEPLLNGTANTFSMFAVAAGVLAVATKIWWLLALLPVYWLASGLCHIAIEVYNDKDMG